VLAAGVSGAGVPVLFGLLLAMEAGVPVPVPADLVILVLGERASAGAVPLWLALVILELVAGVAWLLRRRHTAGRVLAEGCCPACLAAAALAARRDR
jgi:hypothetical protein